MGMIPKYSELQKLTDAEIIERYDKEAQHTVVGTGFYLDELIRRSMQRQTARMLEFTKQIRTWTLVMVVVTVVNAGLVLATVMK